MTIICVAGALAVILHIYAQAHTSPSLDGQKNQRLPDHHMRQQFMESNQQKLLSGYSL